MRPTDVLSEQRRLYEIGKGFLERVQRAEPVDEETRWNQTSTAGFVHILERAGTYHITSDMTAIAEAAGGSMPTQVLQDGDWPSPYGFMLYDRPLALPSPTQVINGRSASDPIGFLWALRPTESNIVLATLGRARSTGVIEPRGTFSWNLGEVPTDMGDDGDSWRPYLPCLLATWTLMQQSLAARETVPAARAERRRCARIGLPENVVVVQLRKFETARTVVDQDGTEIDWSHRWLVSGHWRNQYLPSRQTHRQQWISGYVKGPPDKPLIVKERVSTWVR